MDLQELHTKAMELADRADAQRMQGNVDEANTFFCQSLRSEREAAFAAREQQVGEPTESVLFRSAASLAFAIGDYREAERLACMGLAGNPPAEIADELRSLYDAVSMERNISQLAYNNDSTEQERVTISVPVHERNLLNVLVRKFGWACIL